MVIGIGVMWLGRNGRGGTKSGGYLLARPIFGAARKLSRPHGMSTRADRGVT